jgi:hypothetical protein
MHMLSATAAALEMQEAAGPEQLAFFVLYWTSSQLLCPQHNLKCLWLQLPLDQIVFMRV